MSTKAVYAGTFDVLTYGHLWMIREGARLFDHLVVAIGENSAKHPLFALTDRLLMLSVLTDDLGRVEIESFGHCYLVEYAKAIGAGFILRGIRNQQDFEYERAMRNVNQDLGSSGITTVFLMPPRELAEVSSSLVKGLVGPEGWEQVVARYVPAQVLTHLRSLHRGQS
jgi:pantetheine-phosphate adenylyltransferase